MIRIRLTSEQRTELQALRRDGALRPLERDRVEMLFLADRGWSAPAIATHLGCCTATVRKVFRLLQAQGPRALRHQRPGPPPDAARREQVRSTLAALLAPERTWTAAQLAEEMARQGICLSTRQTRRYLKLQGARWRRTVRTLRHKQDPVRVERARTALATLEKKSRLAS